MSFWDKRVSIDVEGRELTPLTGELLPPEGQKVIRIPEAPSVPVIETREPVGRAALEPDVWVPGLQALLTALALGLMTVLLAWAFAWSWRAPVAVMGLALAVGWLWRLRIADALLWRISTMTGGQVTEGESRATAVNAYLLGNPAQARAAVAEEQRQDDADAKRADLLAFVDRCLMCGCSEGAHGIKASGPDRDAYTARRDTLMALGIAAWKNPERPRGGWKMVASRQRARQLIEKHVLK